MGRNEQLKVLETKLTRQIAQTSIRYEVLSPNDRVLVALSGGKDSYGLVYLLSRLIIRLPFGLDIIGCHVNQGTPGFDPSPLVKWMEENELPLELVEEDTYTTVMQNLEPGATPCAICARLRRGVLYTTARRLGCNKVALAHHREDTVATLMLNLFFAGTIQAMPARYRTNDGDLEVIRPMIEIKEDHLIELSRLVGFPIIPCGLCDAQPDHKRLWVNQLLRDLEERYPDIKSSMLGAIKNVHPSHLLDLDLVKKAEPKE
jgi:tRNA 2-thiocytidine biosynthesis protein TtcA